MSLQLTCIDIVTRVIRADRVESTVLGFKFAFANMS